MTGNLLLVYIDVPIFTANCLLLAVGFFFYGNHSYHKSLHILLFNLGSIFYRLQWVYNRVEVRPL
ncbi:hypothetical protein JOD18_000356 [Gracilibacillus alcaliphilus]|nr:hypothetical protein [Gracilibacillus alcaliphilus]